MHRCCKGKAKCVAVVNAKALGKKGMPKIPQVLRKAVLRATGSPVADVKLRAIDAAVVLPTGNAGPLDAVADAAAELSTGVANQPVAAADALPLQLELSSSLSQQLTQPMRFQLEVSSSPSQPTQPLQLELSSSLS
jgi:hypothetical protein